MRVTGSYRQRTLGFFYSACRPDDARNLTKVSLPQFISVLPSDNSNTTMWWELVVFIYFLTTPSRTHTDAHTHRHTQALSSNCSYKELSVSQWELWPYLEPPVDLFVLAEGRSIKWSLWRKSLARCSTQTYSAAGLQHKNPASRTWPLQHSSSHPVTSPCNPIQMCPDVLGCI